MNIKEKLEKHKKHYYINVEGHRYCIKCYALKLISSQRKELIEEIRGNIGMLRQWLNEDRITDKEMVTNEDLELWLLDKLKKKEGG